MWDAVYAHMFFRKYRFPNILRNPKNKKQKTKKLYSKIIRIHAGGKGVPHVLPEIWERRYKKRSAPPYVRKLSDITKLMDQHERGTVWNFYPCLSTE